MISFVHHLHSFHLLDEFANILNNLGLTVKEMETPTSFWNKQSTIIFLDNFFSFYDLFIIWVEQMSKKDKKK